jgi:hypothetical protein
VGRRSRKRAGAPGGTARAPKPPRPATAVDRGDENPLAADAFAEPAPRRKRGEERDAEVRANLEPLEQGERPRAVTVGAIIAGLLAVSNVVLWAAGVDTPGQGGDTSNNFVGIFLFAIVMGMAAVGMWQSKYWAVLGFQALLALTILIAGLSIAVSGNIAAVILCSGIVLAGGTLFWTLVKAMARIQMPQRAAPRR